MNVWEQRKLFEYCRSGDIRGVIAVLKPHHVHDTTNDRCLQNALYIACENGHTAVAQYLLDNGAYIGCSLTASVRYNHYDCVKLLLEYHADVNCTNAEQKSPISLALQKHPADIKLILLLLQYDAIPSGPFVDNISVQLLKHAKAEDTKVIEKLIDGTIINLTSESTFLSAFDFAFRRACSVELAEKILSSDIYSQVEELYPKAAYYSAKNNWPNILSKLIEKRVDINALTEDQTPLSAACKEGHKSAVKLLLDKGADPNVPNDSGTTALHFAVDGCDDTSTAQMLLSVGTNVNALDRDGVSPLFLACDRGKTEFVRDLLSHGANPNNATVFPYSCYPLHAACRGLHYDVVKLLLELHADVSVRNQFGENALHCAVYIVNPSRSSTDNDKRIDLVQLLHDAGADVNAATETGVTPLYFACRMGQESTVMKMLECGAKVDGISCKKLPLIAACRNEHVSVVQLLLTNGANPNLLEEGYQDQDRDMWYDRSLLPYGDNPTKSALVEACLVQNVELVDMLLEHGADPNLASMCTDPDDSEHKYPLFVAVDKNNSHIVISLLNAGADVNVVDDYGESIVSFATENVIYSAHGQSMEEMRNKLSTVRLLLEHGANVNMQIPDGLSPLGIAVSTRLTHGLGDRSCVSELLQLLVAYGAELRDPAHCEQEDNCYLQEFDILTLPALVRFDGKHRFIVELFRAGAGFQLLARCCQALTPPRQGEKSISLCQAAVLAGYVPNDEELEMLQFIAARYIASRHLIQQLMNWLDEDRHQVPSLQRQCRVVIRRQLSAAARFKSILPAIDKLPLPTILKHYLQFDGPLSEVDLNECIPPTRP